MMSLAHIRAHLLGVWRMARGREDWEDGLDLSTDGVFGSFGVLLFILPMLALTTAAVRSVPFEAAADDAARAVWASLTFPAAFAMEAGQLLLSWIAELAILAGVLRATGAETRAAQTIVGYNWVQLFSAIGSTLAIVIAAPAVTTGALAEIAVMVGLGALVLSLYLNWGLARRAVGLEAGPAVGLISTFLIAGLLISYGLTGLIVWLLSPASSG